MACNRSTPPKTDSSTANLGFEARLRLAADTLRNNVPHLAPQSMAGFVFAFPGLVAELEAQFTESAKHSKAIRRNLKSLRA